MENHACLILPLNSKQTERPFIALIFRFVSYTISNTFEYVKIFRLDSATHKQGIKA